jgi:signal transduction histidine kinase
MRGSVRVRVTAVAVTVTAVALAAGGWALLGAIERTQIARIARATQERVDTIVAQLEANVPPESVALPLPDPLFGFVQVIDGDEVLTASGLPPSAEPILMVAGPGAGERVVSSGIVATAEAGSARVEEALPGAFQRAIELQLSYERVDVAGRRLTVVAASPLAEVNRSLEAVRRSLYVALPFVIALVGGVAWFVTGRALRPVEAMRAEVEAITHSTLHRRVPEPASADEVGRLARTMNDMLDRLESAVERQRRFVADASHELRSPVAALRTELEVALRSGDEAALRAAVAGALAEEARLEDLLADLLVLASIDEGVAPAAAEVDLRAVAAEEAARARAVPVSTTGAGVVRGSKTQLRRVVANLVDNAARHARTSVSVAVEGGRLVVDDDGPGIAPEDRERVFERFTRLDDARARDHGGAGLGLSLVRAVAAAHGGRAWAESSPAGGARLVVDLPTGS